jgi:hypothetical protein
LPSPEHAAGGPCVCSDGSDRANPQIPSPVSRSLSLSDRVPVRPARHRPALAADRCTTRKRGHQEASPGPLRDFVCRHRSRGRRGASLVCLPLPSTATTRSLAGLAAGRRAPPQLARPPRSLACRLAAVQRGCPEASPGSSPGPSYLGPAVPSARGRASSYESWLSDRSPR